MTDEELLFQIKDKLEKEKGISGIEFIRGGRKSEFSVPDRLIVPLGGTNNNVYEITSKVGNSWFFNDNNFIRLLGVNFKFDKNQRFYVYRYCLLEKTGLFDYIIWPWINEKVWGKVSRPVDIFDKLITTGTSWSIFDEKESFYNDLRKFCIKWREVSEKESKFFGGKISCPRIRYFIDDGCDEQYYADILEITLPSIESTDKTTSYIVQFRKYRDENTRLFYTIRKLSGGKELISIDEEKELTGGWKEFTDIVYRDSINMLLDWQGKLLLSGARNKKWDDFINRFGEILKKEGGV